jgi:hypothetical protein
LFTSEPLQPQPEHARWSNDCGIESPSGFVVFMTIASSVAMRTVVAAELPSLRRETVEQPGTAGADRPS